ncbi:phage head-tail connector protein [Bacillus velezensis]|uniref:phage head-tail connector protein n=1 Tax=Bacillus velezensis TaxID=492670 RepID=UPI00203B9887|nr:phage head-tail connector protein [Bacillus velezensis]MCM3108775.1 phage head-tail connector protein [Bacillus velezensis]MED3448941.1 phage head-tail connector protein [Bacillus velezensis]
MDIQTIKNMLGIKTDSHDAYLAEVLPLFIDQAKDWCNNSFTVNGEEKLPAGVKLYVAKAIEHNMTPSNLSGRSMGDVSYSYETELPSSITELLAPYRKLRVI